MTAVDGVSLDIRENEFFALLGPSGCGKTTLLRVLAGFETPSDGRILLDGVDIAPIPPNRRPLNLMFQSYALFPHMTVRGQRLLRAGDGAAAARRDPRARRRDPGDDELTALADRKPEQLSGGQKQRVALARALVKRPRLLLLDEPLGALDKKLRGAMQLELKRLQHEVGITFVVVTHDQEEALVMADRMAVLRDGRLLQCDTPHEIYERPADRFVADFIGVMNFLAGRAVGGRRRRRRAATLIAGALPDGVAAGCRRGRRGAAGARPAVPAAGDVANRVAGTVEALAYHGLDLQLHVRTALSDKPFLVRLTADAADRRPVGAGDTVEIGWNAADTRIFAD